MTISTALESRVNQHALSVLLTLDKVGGGSVLLFLGTETIERAPSSVYSGIFCPMLAGGVRLLRQGAPGTKAQPAQWSFTIRNGLTVDTSGTRRTPAQLMRECYLVGSVAVLDLHVLDGGSWLYEQVSRGVIVDAELDGRGNLQIDVAGIDSSAVLTPELTVQGDSMLYGTQEGEQPQGSDGAPVPLAFGDFSPTAIQAWTDTPLEGIEGDVLGPALGIKCPLVPLVPLAEKYVWPDSTVLSANENHAFMALFACGDTASPSVTVIGDPAATYGRHGWYPAAGTASGHEDADAIHLLRMFTWSEELDRALPYAKDQSGDMDDVPSTSYQKEYACAGDWTSWLTTHTDVGTRRADVQAFYIAQTEPDFIAATGDPAEYWMGTCQSLFIPADGVGGEPATLDGINFSLASVTYAKQAYDGKLDTYATVGTGGRLLLRLQPDGPRLGPIRAVRVWVAVHPDSTSTDCRMALRRSVDLRALLRGDWFTTPNVSTDGVVDFDPSVGRMFAATWGKRRLVGSSGAQIKDWDFTFPRVASPYELWAPEVLLWPADSGDLRVVGVWLEVVHVARQDRPTLRPTMEGTTVYRRDADPGQLGRFGGRRGEWTFVEYRGNLEPIEPDAREWKVFVAGRGPKEPSPTPKYGGSAGDLLETPAQVALFMIDKRRNEYANAERDVSDFGSFQDAHNWYVAKGIRGAFLFDRRVGLDTLHNALGEHGMATIERHDTTTSPFYKWRMFVDSPDPASDFPGRIYQRLIGKDDILVDSMRVRATSLRAIRNRFVLRYGYHAPTRDYTASLSLDENATTLTTDAAAYVSLCADSVARYRVEREDVIELPWIWDPVAAEALLKYHADKKATQRVGVTLTLRTLFRDLMPGHVIEFEDDLADLWAYPGTAGASTWSGHLFNVLRADLVEASDGFVTVQVVAEEVYTPAA